MSNVRQFGWDPVKHRTLIIHFWGKEKKERIKGEKEKKGNP